MAGEPSPPKSSKKSPVHEAMHVPFESGDEKNGIEKAGGVPGQEHGRAAFGQSAAIDESDFAEKEIDPDAGQPAQ